MKLYPCMAVVMLTTLSACKKDPAGVKSETLTSQTFQLASGTGEMNRTAEFFQNAWDIKFVRKLDELPNKSEAKVLPYSGYWYPESKGGTNDSYDPFTYTPGSSSPLVKYDQAFYGVRQFRSASWEAHNHSRGHISWAGHCNGFSSASVRHKEPEKPVMRNGVTFQPTDIKALLAEIYMSADYFFLGGARCNGVSGISHPDQRLNPTQMDACEDVNPGTFHTAIANWVGVKGQPIVFDISSDDQVWNYPLYGYEASYRDVTQAEALAAIGSRNIRYIFNPNASRLVYVSNKLTYAAALSSEAAPAGAIPQTKWVEYILELDEDGQILGGEWTSESRKSHPDFIWVPLDPIQSFSNSSFGNPYLDIDEILEMWAESAGYASLAEVPPMLTSRKWAGDWGKFDGLTISIDGVERGVAFLGDKNVLSIKLEDGHSALALSLDGQDLVPLNPGENPAKFEIESAMGLNKINFSWKKNSTTLVDYTFFHGMW